MKSFRSWIRRDSRRRILLWTTLLALLTGVLDLGRPLEDYFLVGRNALRQHPASGEIVVVAVDDRTLAELEQWPWPRRVHGELATRLDRMGARKIAFDIDFSSRSTPAEDQRFADAMSRLRTKPILAMRFVIDPRTGERRDFFPIEQLRQHAELANINAQYSFFGSVWNLPFQMPFGDTAYPGLSVALAQREHPETGTYRIDYAIDPRSIPVISAVDLMKGRVPASAIAGKTVVIGTASLQLGDIYFLPGHGQMSGVYLQALGAETLRQGRPANFGWFAPFLLSLALVAACLTRLSLRASIAAVSIATAALFAAAIFLESRQIAVTIIPSFMLLVGTGVALAWRMYRQAFLRRGTTNPVSGLPNLNALREHERGQDRPLILAKIHNYAEIAATFPVDTENSLVHQIVARFGIGSANATIYQGDDGVFAWFIDEHEISLVREYVEGLYALIIRPITAAGRQVDLAVSFGLEASARPIANRLGSALLAAEEAASEGLRWKQHDAEHLHRSAWKLSLLSQLDTGIDAGDVWVAYQPKLDLATRRITGAEALARWSHPEKGPISPVEFIKAAEQSGRIRKLTTFVLDHAIRSAAAVNRSGGAPFEVSVNISGRLIADYSLPTLVAELLAHHRLAPSLLTLEVTETAAISSSASALAPLRDLRNLGVQISIDDYGTGLSTLEYIRRMPATEIKIDKQFVKSLAVAESDRIMVESTISLAHSLGQRVVAEGVEDRETLEILAAMNCDTVQGFFTGVPMTYQRLVKLLEAQSQEIAA
jgi:EAL domain-containing protein (putative c-di-GMP-specific phosphodiesterase class I)/CHASE2 domain-containing sensor protein